MKGLPVPHEAAMLFCGKVLVRFTGPRKMEFRKEEIIHVSNQAEDDSWTHHLPTRTML